MAGQVVGSQVPADPTGATAVPGAWVGGNVADVRAQAVTSAASGPTAGAAINADLVAEQTRATPSRSCAPPASAPAVSS
jgi:thioredoxin reductase